MGGAANGCAPQLHSYALTFHGRVASQFTVTYSGIGAASPKSNANVFTMYNDYITKIDVYMTGENTMKT
tara:strand:+ start:455 stop:661 length:207 start_codon:yes stop_codon:yes gene_type:complete